jgi:hypothetical protein
LKLRTLFFYLKLISGGHSKIKDFLVNFSFCGFALFSVFSFFLALWLLWGQRPHAPAKGPALWKPACGLLR